MNTTIIIPVLIIALTILTMGAHSYMQKLICDGTANIKCMFVKTKPLTIHIIGLIFLLSSLGVLASIPA